MAVGGHVGVTGSETALAELWDGREWSIQPVPQPPGTRHSLETISCTSRAACIAVGDGTFRWNGVAWSVALNDANGVLVDLSCTSQTLCLGAGSDEARETGALIPATARWDGTDWSTIRTPRGGATGDDSYLAGISCLSRTVCVSVGTAGIGNGVTQVPLAERWNGLRWSVQRPPRARGSWDNELKDVSCPNRAMCAAVGYASYFGRGDEATIEVWDATNWVSQSSPALRAARDQDLNAVSCVSREVCTAVGTWEGRGFPVHPLIERTTNALAKRFRSVRRPPPFTG